MKKIVWLTVFLSLGAGVHAQDAGRPLAWEDCVAIAAKKNPDLASSSLAVEASRSSYYGSFNGLMPQVNLSNSYSDSKGATGASRWSASASASIDLWNAGQLAAIRSASASLTQAQASRRLASANLRFSLRRAFAQLLFAQRNVAVSQTILEMRQKSAQLVALRYDSGRESRGNMLRSKAQALQAETDHNQARRDLRTAQRALDAELGLDGFSAATATGTLSARAVPALPDELGPLLALRPDLAVSQAAVRGAEAAVSRARSSLWPSLSASYSRSRLGPTEFPSARTSWSAGGTLSLPLFSGGPTAVYHAVSAARKSLEGSRQDLRSARDEALVDIETSWSGFAAAAEGVLVQDALLEAARQRNEEADVRYASGLLSYDNWEIIASDRINSERRFVESQRTAVTAEADWDRSIGRTLEE